jgi:lysine biosynthesis protein LysW
VEISEAVFWEISYFEVKMAIAQCPLCSSNIEVGLKTYLGQCVLCTVCETELEVVWLYPLGLDVRDDASITPSSADQLDPSNPKIRSEDGY